MAWIPWSVQADDVEVTSFEHDAYTERLPDSEVEFEMLAIPGGTFIAGSRDGDSGQADDEIPRHLVEIRSFWMGKTEVTWDEFDLFHEGHPASDRENEAALEAKADAITRPTGPYMDMSFGHGRHCMPALAMSHHAAMEYCHWLSVVTGKHYRLPTEAEWEYACRAGSKTAYSFGEDAGMLGEYAWFEDNSDDQTHMVGQKRPNAWGLHDMYGNVVEWCLDQYEPDAYQRFPVDVTTVGPVCLPSSDRYPHVVRGGSWVDSPAKCRSAARRGSDKSWNQSDPELPQSIWWVADADFVGFRVVRAVEEQENLKGLRSKIRKYAK